ncbi:hypothetical protein RCL1_000862 [Eukaryota sp. TZLM3-RCL]
MIVLTLSTSLSRNSMLGRFKNAAGYVQQKMKDIDKSLDAALSVTGDIIPEESATNVTPKRPPTPSNSEFVTPLSSRISLDSVSVPSPSVAPEVPTSSPSPSPELTESPQSPVDPLDILAHQVEEMKKSKQDLLCQLSESKKQSEELHRKYYLCNSDLQQHKQLVSQSFTELENLKSEFSKRLGKEQKTIANLRSKIQSLTEENSNQQLIISEFQEKTNHLVSKSQLEELEAQNKTLLANDSAKMELISTLNSKIQGLNDKITGILSENELLIKRLDSLRSEQETEFNPGKSSNNHVILTTSLTRMQSFYESKIMIISRNFENLESRFVLIDKNLETIKNTAQSTSSVQSNLSIFTQTDDVIKEIEHEIPSKIDCSIQMIPDCLDQSITTDLIVNSDQSNPLTSFEILALKAQISQLQAQNNSLNQNLATLQRDLASVGEPYNEILSKYHITLDLLGAKEEELESLKDDFDQAKKAYKDQIIHLLNLINKPS